MTSVAQLVEFRKQHASNVDVDLSVVAH
jgi:hypothetical protein